MKFLLVVILFTSVFTSKLVSAQSDSIKSQPFDFLLRAKVLGFVIIEDRWVRSFSIGGELRYKDRFSFTADLVHFRWKYEKEVYKTPGNYEDYDEFALFDARNYIALEARYYPKIGKTNFYRPYANIFSKIGGRFLHIQDKYPPDINEVIRLNSDFKDLGASLGLQFGGNFGFDVNMGVAYRFELKNEDIYQQDGNIAYTHDVQKNNWIFNIRMNFYLNLSSISKDHVKK